MTASDDRGNVSWESLWPALLGEAARIASMVESSVDSVNMGRAAAAITLCRASWESYVNEFIEWRGLPAKLQSSPFTPKLAGIHKRLPSLPDEFEGFWPELMLVHDIRNAIVHYKARERSAGHGPKSLPRRLKDVAVLPEVRAGTNWERQVLRRETALWCVDVIGKSIVRLEEVPDQRRRSAVSVRVQVRQALSVLDGNHV
jgi:hypothetical protein